MPKLSDDSWPSGDPALAAFVEDLRILAAGPAPEPRPGLLAVMRQGVVDPIAMPPGRSKMLVNTVLGSLVAKLALAMGVAAAGVTAAGAAGALPDAAQHAVASVVDATTPFALPDPTAVRPQAANDGHRPASGSNTTSSSTPTTVGGTGTTLAGTGTTLPGTGTGENRTENHGACVSIAARDRSGPESESHGKTVSSVARSDCGKAATSTTVVPSTTSSSVPGSTTSTTSTTSDARQNGNRGNSGESNGRVGPSGTSGRS